MRWSLLTALYLVAALAAAKENKDKDKLQGLWVVESREVNGKTTPAADLKALKVTINDGTITIDDGEKKQNIPYKIDPSRKPKSIDLANTGIDGKETTPAIYELNGDSLKLCWSEKTEERPTEFTGKSGSGQTLMVFKRVKK
jgi:uncharacterized protein (TIGR03067 family)